MHLYLLTQPYSSQTINLRLKRQLPFHNNIVKSSKRDNLQIKELELSKFFKQYILKFDYLSRKKAKTPIQQREKLKMNARM